MPLVSPWGAVGPCHLRWLWGRMQGVYLNRTHWSFLTPQSLPQLLKKLTFYSHSVYCVCLPFEVTVGKCFIRNQFLGPLLWLVCNLQLWGLTYLFLCDCFVSTLLGHIFILSVEWCTTAMSSFEPWPLGNLIPHRRNKTYRDFEGLLRFWNIAKETRLRLQSYMWQLTAFQRYEVCFEKHSNMCTPSLRWWGPCAFKRSAVHRRPASSWSWVEHHRVCNKLFIFNTNRGLGKNHSTGASCILELVHLCSNGLLFMEVCCRSLGRKGAL